MRAGRDPWLDPQTIPVRSQVVAPLVDWIHERWSGSEPVRLLDLGCGDLILSRLVPPHVRVDGWDPAPAAREAARATAAEARVPGEVFADVAEAPVAAYDGVILNSVVQYLPSASAVGDLLAACATRLRPGPDAAVVVTDVPGPDRRRRHDASDLGRFLVAALGFTGAVAGIARTAARSPGPLLCLTEHEVVDAFARAGLQATALPRNLSPLRRRRTYVAVRPTTPGADPPELRTAEVPNGSPHVRS